MQLSLWKRETLESLVRDLQEENKRLQRINFGRVLAVVFFTFWFVLVCLYFSPPNKESSSKCSVRTSTSSKSLTDSGTQSKQ